MIQSLNFAHRVHLAFQPTPRGVIGLVDELLELCRHYQLRMHFRDGRCAIGRLGADAREQIDLAVPKSVFRAVLARVAAMCNEQHPQAVSPYGGEGSFSLTLPNADQGSPPATYYATFTNTPADQALEMRFDTSTAILPDLFTVLLRDKKIITVYGKILKYLPHTPNHTDHGSYGIFTEQHGEERLVALFSASEVLGVFLGKISEQSAP